MIDEVIEQVARERPVPTGDGLAVDVNVTPGQCEDL